MKTHPSFVALLLSLATAFSNPLAAAHAPVAPAKAYSVTVVERHNSTLIERGDSEFAVRRKLGEPTRKLDRESWAYARFQAMPERAQTDDCTTLLLVFSKGQVADIKLINDRAAELIVANAQSNRTARPVVVAK
jgi:hypothetical protein